MLFGTVFDEPSADLLAELDVPAFKIASADLVNTPLLRHVAALGKPIFLSTGGGTIEDVERALDTDPSAQPAALPLQCTAAYPARHRRAPTARDRDATASASRTSSIGLSDHQNGIAMALVAYMLGARVIEKHFTLNHAWKGSDHAYSLMPEGMRRLVRDLHRVPEALGDGVKRRLPSEERPLEKMGKKLVAARDLPAGHRARRREISSRKLAGRRRPAALRARPLAREAAAASALRRAERRARRRRARRRARRARLAPGVTTRPALRSLRPRCRRHRRRGPARRGLHGWARRARDARREPRRHHRETPRMASVPTTATSPIAGRIEMHCGEIEAEWGTPHLLVNNAGLDSPPDAPAEEVGPVRDVPRGVVRRGSRRQRQGRVPLLPGDRRCDGARGARLDRQRLFDLRAPLARPGPLRLPPRARARPSSSRSPTRCPSPRSSTSRATSRRTGQAQACA